MMTGAGADRIQNGMRKAFGKVISVAARVYEEDRLLFVRTNVENLALAKDALRRGKSKFPTPEEFVVPAMAYPPSDVSITE